MDDAAGSGDHVLIMTFSHGDYDSANGLSIGVDLFTNDDFEKYLKPSHAASILWEYPDIMLKRILKNTAKLQKGPWPLRVVVTSIFRDPSDPTRPDQYVYDIMFLRSVGGDHRI